MPNAKDHQAGAFFLNTIYWLLSPRRHTIASFLLSITSALIGGMAPDILEPATSPNHRGGWHYIMGLLSGIPAYVLWQSTEVGFIIGAFCVGYFSHFVLDVIG